MSMSVRGRVSQIAGELIQVWDIKTGHSIYLDVAQIVGGDELRLNDEVLVEGDETRRRGRRLSGEPTSPALPDAAAN